MSDRQLRQEILDVFQWDPRIEAAHLGVNVENGVVTLSGLVESEEERHATKEAICHVAGVRSVLDQIEVRANATEHNHVRSFELATD